MSRFAYKNISGSKQVLMGIGEVEVDGIIKTDEPFENPNFEPLNALKKSSDPTPTASKEEEEDKK